MKPSAHAKRLARQRAVERLGQVGKYISNPTLSPADVLGSVDRETAEREKDVAALRREISLLRHELYRLHAATQSK